MTRKPFIVVSSRPRTKSAATLNPRRNEMTKRTKIILAGAATAAIAAGGAGVALGTGGDDDATERPISGSALESASAAALEHTGGGQVTGTEVGDEESYYEVEVTLEDGTQTDVQLDRSFNVVGDEADSGEEDEAGEG
jgi:hypothetical protein